MISNTSERKRIVILGGGFAGVYTAMRLESLLKQDEPVDIVLANRENYFVFQPMLAEIVSGSIGLMDIVSPIHRLLKRTQLFIRDVEAIDLKQRTVTLSPGFRPRPTVLAYDHLVLAMGNVTDFRDFPGLHEHALPFKTLADAVTLRNHVIHALEEATIEEDRELKQQLLTFVVGGGGFSGVEVVAELNDFVRSIARKSPRLDPAEVRVVLIHSGSRILDRELPEKLGLYAQKVLRKRGVEIRLQSRLKTATREAAVLATGERIPTKTVVATVPSSPNPVVASLDLPNERGKLLTDAFLRVSGQENVWALGDCALIPDPSGTGFAPPTAQHAVRESQVAARNIVAALRGGKMETFAFRGLGKLGSLGHHRAVAELFGRVRLSGRLAWFVWRTLYWAKLPGADRKLKVALSWLLDVLIPPETVQLRMDPSRAISQLHFEPGENVFRQGDLGDSFYIILDGQVDVIQEENGEERKLATLGPGDYFGEMALLRSNRRSATIRCTTPLSLLSMRQSDFGMLCANLPKLRGDFEEKIKERLSQNQALAAASDAVKRQSHGVPTKAE